jgi:MFS family permease
VLSFLALAAALLPGPDAAAATLLIVSGVLLMAGNGVSFAAAAEMAGPRRVGTALGLQNTVLAVAVAIAPPAFGAAVGLLSWPAAFALAAAPPLVGWIVLGPLVATERLTALSQRRPN